MKSIEDQVKDELSGISEKLLEVLDLNDNITKAVVALSTTLYSVLQVGVENCPGGVPEIWIELHNLSSIFSAQGVQQLYLMAKRDAEKKHKAN